MTVTVLKKGCTTFDLKIIGILLMFIDHVHQMFVPFGAPNWLDWFGRPVATLFFFVSVIGFSHTHNKKNYMLRLYLSMVLMSLFTYLLGNVVHYDQVVLVNNIFRDLFIGTLLMYAIDQLVDGKKQKNWKKIGLSILLFLLPLISSFVTLMILANPIMMQNRWVLMLLTTFLPDFNLAENGLMVLLIPLLYIARNKRVIQCLLIVLVAAIYFFLGTTQWLMVFAILPISLYNGQKGRGMKYFFYLFYPAHIAILYLLSAFLYNH